MADDDRIALVSGANRGIGLEISRQLAAGGIRVVMGARDPAKGEVAAAALAEEGLPVSSKQLDVADPGSVDQLATDIEAEHGRLDVLVNNAGVVLDGGHPGVEADIDVLKATLETNTFGAWRLTKALLPLMRRGGYGRIVNVSSGMGGLTEMNGTTAGYRLSKAGLNVMTRILASELAGENIKVNSACPGFVATDMGRPLGATLSVEEGADTPVWLATLPDDGPSGLFFRRREQIAW